MIRAYLYDTKDLNLHIHDQPDLLWNDSTLYLWSNGNYGCDCNRGLFCGVPEYCDDDTKCSLCGGQRFLLIMLCGTDIQGQNHFEGDLWDLNDWPSHVLKEWSSLFSKDAKPADSYSIHAHLPPGDPQSIDLDQLMIGTGKTFIDGYQLGSRTTDQAAETGTKQAIQEQPEP